MAGDDSIDDAARTFLAVGQKIKFPKGTHKSPITIIYANSGKNVDGNIEIDGALGAIIQDKLVLKYSGKTGIEDVTNNSNSQN